MLAANDDRKRFCCLLGAGVFIPACLAAAVLALPASSQAQEGAEVGVWNGFQDQLNVVECVNGRAQALEPRIEVLNDRGELLGDYAVRVPGYGTRHIILNELGIEDQYGTYLVETEEDSALRCHTVFYRRDASGKKAFEYGFSIPVEESLSGESAGVYNSINPRGAEVPTYNWLSIYNPGDAQFSAALETYDQTGVLRQARSVGPLLPGQRSDYALGHEEGQVVGIYKIVPDDLAAPYGAYLARYQQEAPGVFSFAFVLFPSSGDLDSGSLSASTMDPATNWGEIANPNPEPVTVRAEIRNRDSALLYEEIIALEPFSQEHVYINEHLGERTVGSFRVESQSGKKIIAESMFYGHPAAGGAEVIWAYGSQPAESIYPGGAGLAPINTFLGASNWYKEFFSNQNASSALLSVFDQEGGEIGLVQAKSTFDIPLHESVGGDFAGLVRAESESAFSAELLRVYPHAEGGIGTIVKIRAMYLPAGSGGPGGGEAPVRYRTAPEPPEISNLRSGISLLISGTVDTDYVEEYLYHDIALDDHKVIYLNSSASIELKHNERNILAFEVHNLHDSNCALSPYCQSTGWTGPDGVLESDDEYIIGEAGADGIVGSADDGDIYFRVDRFEQFHPYQKIYNPAIDPESEKLINIPFAGTAFRFGDLEYETGMPVLGTFGTNGGAYGTMPYRTIGRYQRGMRTIEQDELHVLTYWDNDERIMPANGPSIRGHSSDGNMAYLVVDPKTPVIRLSAAEGEEFFTTALTSYHTPHVVPQVSYISSGVVIELINIRSSAKMFYSIDGAGPFEYRRPFDLSPLADGEHIFECWIEGGPVKRRKLVLNPGYPSSAETHPRLLWSSEGELSHIRLKMTRAPFDEGYYNFKRNLASSYERLEIPFPNRTGWRGVISAAYVPFFFMLPYYVEQNYTVSSAPEYAVLAKRALISLMNVDFIGSEDISDNSRPSTDVYSIPNSGHNSYVYLGLGYDLAIGAFRRLNHEQGISPIEDLKIREQLAGVEHIMLKYRENKATRNETWQGWEGQVGGNMHWAHGEELVAYVIGAAMPSYSSPLYGTSGFDGTQASYLWAPHPDQAATWFELLTDPNIETPGHPNVRSAARYNYIYGTYQQLLQYPRSNSAVWDLPPQGIFWQAANAFAGATNLYELGEIPVASLAPNDMIRVPDGNLSEYQGVEDVWTLEGRKLQTVWNRSFNLPTVSGDNGGLFIVEFGGYETPFVQNAALVQSIHKRLFGASLSPKITGYFETRFDRAAGNFDPHYLKQRSTSGSVYVYENGQYYYPLLTNSQFISATMPLAAYNPLLADRAKTKAALAKVKELAAEYPYFYYRKFYANPVDLILYEPDQSLY